MVIRGIDQSGDAWYDKWIGIVIDAISCLYIDIVDGKVRRYYWIHLPEIGGYYDQDEEIMYIWEFIKTTYIEELNNYLQEKAERNK